MDSNKSESTPAGEPRDPSASGSSPADPVLDALLNIWYVGVGTVVLAKERGAEFVKAAVEKGREVEPGVREPFKKAGEAVTGAASEVGSRIKESLSRGAGRIENLVDERIAKTVQEELKTLNQKLDELKAKLEELQKPRPSSPPEA